MRTRKYRNRLSLAMMMTDLTLASWETITRRTLLMMQNDCSPAEYQRMVNEKAEAAARSASRLVASGGRVSLAALLAPWHTRAMANAKRLRKK